MTTAFAHVRGFNRGPVVTDRGEGGTAEEGPEANF